MRAHGPAAGTRGWGADRRAWHGRPGQHGLEGGNERMGWRWKELGWLEEIWPKGREGEIEKGKGKWEIGLRLEGFELGKFKMVFEFEFKTKF